MTSIEGPAQGGFSLIHRSGQGLAIGQKLVADVLAATRRGATVLIDNEAVDLKGPSRLADAKTLTLRVVGVQVPSGQQVEVVEADGKPLNTLIKAELVNKPPVALQPSTSTILQSRDIVVSAKPVTSDGQDLGPAVALRLHIRSSGASGHAVPQTSISSTDPALPALRQSTGEIATNTQTEKAEPGPSTQQRTQSLPNPVVQPSDRIATSPTTDIAQANKLAPDVTAKGGYTAEGAARGGEPIAATQGGRLPNQTDSSKEPAPAKSMDPRGGKEEAIQPPGAGSSDRPSRVSKAGDAIMGEVVRAPTTSEGNAGDFAQRFQQMSRSLSAAPTAFPASIPTSQRASDAVEVAMPATVASRTANGQLVIRSADHLLKVEQPVDLPVGAPLLVSLVPGSSLQTGPAPSSAFSGNEAPFAKLISLLEDIDRASRSTVADDHAQASRRQLPSADRHLAARLLSLLSLAGTNPATNASPSNEGEGGLHVDQADQIKSLMHKIGANASEPLADGWRSLTFPLGSDPVQGVLLYYRQDDHTAGDETSERGDEGGEAKRAVFDISLSHIGRCQIDALCQGQRFDLLVRSESEFSETDQREISSLFSGACEVAGMHGGIGFTIGHFFEPPRSSNLPTDVRT